MISASTRGIGYACVKACAKEGAIVYMAARNLELAKQKAEELNAEEVMHQVVVLDAAREKIV